MELAKHWEAMVSGTHKGDHDEHGVVDPRILSWTAVMVRTAWFLARHNEA